MEVNDVLDSALMLKIQWEILIFFLYITSKTMR